MRHRHAAELLLARGAPAEQAATYLVRTIPVGDRFVVATLRRAAERSFAQGAPEAAVAYLRRALAEPPGAADRAEVLGELGLGRDAHRPTSPQPGTSVRRSTASTTPRAEPKRCSPMRTRSTCSDVRSANPPRCSEGRASASAKTMRSSPTASTALLITSCRYDVEQYPIAAAVWAEATGWRGRARTRHRGFSSSSARSRRRCEATRSSARSTLPGERCASERARVRGPHVPRQRPGRAGHGGHGRRGPAPGSRR